MLPLQGILYTALYEDDLERSVRFYRDLFDLEVLFSDDRLCALSVAGRQVLLLFRKGASKTPLTTAG
ncbi:MAG: VOC family protein, partial [Burkholderiales bacterium]